MFTMPKNSLIATTSTRPGLWQKAYFFISALLHSLHCDDEKKKTFSPIANWYYLHYVLIMSRKYFPHSYYVHYAMIMTKIYVFISALRVLHLDHVKKYTFMKKNYFPIATTFTTFVIMTIFFICCCYVHYAMISTMSTTP